MALATGKILNNRYRIVKLLGQGGFGAVYRAWDMNLNRPCAVKENLDGSPEAQEQFGREATMLANLIHPNLSRVIDYFFIPSQGQYFVMDFIEGDDLEETLAEHGNPLPETRVLPWIMQICDVLSYLHEQKSPVIHRDIKPANIKITPEGKAVLVDFGIAKIFDPKLKTTIGARAITPGYSPFEQYGQAPTDERTDIYALGATAYTMLTGKEPTESIARVAGSELPSPRDLNESISSLTEQTILKAIQLMPPDRFQTAKEFRTALASCLDGISVDAEPSTPATEMEPDQIKAMHTGTQVETSIQQSRAPIASAIPKTEAVTHDSIPAPLKPARHGFPKHVSIAGINIPIFAAITGIVVVVALIGTLIGVLREENQQSVTPILTEVSAAPATTRPAIQNTQTNTAENTAFPTPTITLEEAAWITSAHADVAARSFAYWNNESPQEVPTECAGCHSLDGYIDYLGADKSKAGSVENPAPIGSTISCEACHNEAAEGKTNATLPAEVNLTGLGRSAICADCHHGRKSMTNFVEAIEAVGLEESPDTVSGELSFVNIHHSAPAAILYGSLGKGGFEYPDKYYDIRNFHVEGYDTCIGCHEPHTLEPRYDECLICHQGVVSDEALRRLRMVGSASDYDGDGDLDEGIYYELMGLQELLYQAIVSYANEVAGTHIAYEANVFPNFFIDTNGDGQTSTEEAQADNAYQSWTPRLLRAAYNYHAASQDPGAYAHNGKYVIELIFDSIEDLNTALRNPVDLSMAQRGDQGHFNGGAQAFRQWDEEGEIRQICAKCHSAKGLATFIEKGTELAAAIDNGFVCESCHRELSNYTLLAIDNVPFPSGDLLSFGENEYSNLCLVCHQGRHSTLSLTAQIEKASAGKHEVSEELSFTNAHYLHAGATLFGTEAKGAYEYDRKTYAGRNYHVIGYDTCITCHDSHTLRIKSQVCSSCHVDSKISLQNIRMSGVDFDGDGNVTEGLAYEIDTLIKRLYNAIIEYTMDRSLPPIIYAEGHYPYFFNDLNNNGIVDAGETNDENLYTSWTPSLMTAAYNYHWTITDPGGYAHNGLYILQILYDSIEALGGDLSGLTRP